MGKELKTLEFYETHAKEYVNATINADMSDTYQRFLKYLPEKGKLLDLGCGSGRDTLFFMKNGFEVTAIDGSSNLCKLAEKITGIPVICKSFDQLDYKNEFDVVWACASLLHVPKSKMKEILIKIKESLKENGILYVSYKVGDSERETPDGKHYSYYNEKDIVPLFKDISLTVLEYWISEDTLKRAEQWLNVIVQKRSEDSK